MRPPVGCMCLACGRGARGHVYMIVMRAGKSMSRMPQENSSRNRFRRDVGGEAEGWAGQNNDKTPGVLSARPWETLSLCNRAISICEYIIHAAIRVQRDDSRDDEEEEEEEGKSTGPPPAFC